MAKHSSMAVYLSVLVFLLVSYFCRAIEIDRKGYILYCPCMGRFGNQAEHFLGALSFAHGLDRTLVLPHWVEYRTGEMRSIQVPFDEYIDVKPLTKYHRVITMDRFMKELAPTIWPVGQRTVYCYSARDGKTGDSCNAKDGNPFGPFWDHFNIDFDKSVFYSPLYFDTHDHKEARGWKNKFPPSKHLVMAFTGAPASFPARESDIALQAYVKWSAKIADKADKYIQENLKRPYVAIHLRNGADFERACDHLEGMNNMFASAQCLGYRNEHGKLTKDLCLPPQKTILKQVVKIAKKIKAKTLFVATDNDPMIEQLTKALKFYKVAVVTRRKNEPHVDLAILEKSDHYICNCVSSFSAFVTRMRRVTGRPTSFWAFTSKGSHDEL